MNAVTRSSCLNRLAPTARRCRLVLASLLLAASGVAQANTFCVGNSGELQGALTDASDGGMYNGQDNTIEVVRGTYSTGTATGNGPFHYASSAGAGKLAIYGGYDAGCVTRLPRAALTVLSGNHASQVLSLRSATARISVFALTIENGETTAVGAGLSINPFASDQSPVTVADNIIRDNHTTGQAGGLLAVGYGLTVANNVIAGNSADGGDAAGELLTEGANVGSVYGNTVVYNTTTLAGAAGGLYFAHADLTGFVNDNIFLYNTNYGVYLASGNTRFDYNDYGVRGGIAPITSIGDVSVAPQFVNAAGGDFHLAANSPLLAASSDASQQVDPDGNKAPARGKIDIGAYFETVFIDGFDGN